MCVFLHVCHNIHVKTRGPLCGFDSLFPVSGAGLLFPLRHYSVASPVLPLCVTYIRSQQLIINSEGVASVHLPGESVSSGTESNSQGGTGAS